MTSKIAAAAAIVLLLAHAAAAAAPPTRELTRQELIDLIVGSLIQASRGNDTASSLKRLDDAIAQGKKFRIIALEDVPDDWNTVVPAGMGGGGPWEYVIERMKQQNVPLVPNTTVKAVEALSKHIGKTFDAAVRVEGGNAALNSLLAASDLGIPVVDTCLSGRGRPEIEQQIPWINGIPSTPAALVTRWGDVIILDRTVDDFRTEDLGRGIAVASGGGASIAMNPMSGRELKRGSIGGSLTQAISFGRAVREAAAQGRDPVDALVAASGGFELFRGVVTKAVGKGERGFTWWDVELRGVNEFAGHLYKVYVKNENIVTWLDGKPDAMVPDFIADVDPQTGYVHYGGDLGAYKEGAEVALVGWPASPLWRTPKGVEVFGPRHFGFDFDYVPIESIQRARRLPAR